MCAHCKSGKCQTLHHCDEATLQYLNVIADSYHLYLTVTTFEGVGNFDRFYQMENFKVVYFGEWLNQAHIRLVCLLNICNLKRRKAQSENSVQNQQTRELISAQKMSHKYNNKDQSCQQWLSPGMWINVPLVEFMYLIYVCVLACQVSYYRWLRSLLLRLQSLYTGLIIDILTIYIQDK